MKITEAYKPGTVIHCETKEEAKRILRLADAQGWCWSDWKSYLDGIYWYVYKEDSCYDLFKGHYGGKPFYEEDKYNIIPSTEIEDDVDTLHKEKRTARREIAIAAMQGKLSGGSYKFENGITEEYAKILAKEAFIIADAFLKYEEQNDKNKQP